MGRIHTSASRGIVGRTSADAVSDAATVAVLLAAFATAVVEVNANRPRAAALMEDRFDFDLSLLLLLFDR